MSNHLIYRARTQRWQHNWLDRVVAEENGKRVAQSTGKFYHAAVVLNAALAVAITQPLPLESREAPHARSALEAGKP